MLNRQAVEEIKVSLNFDRGLVERILHPDHDNHHLLRAQVTRDLLVASITRQLNPLICEFVEAEACARVPPRISLKPAVQVRRKFSLHTGVQRHLRGFLEAVYEKAGRRPDRVEFRRSEANLRNLVIDAISRMQIVRRFVE